MFLEQLSTLNVCSVVGEDSKTYIEYKINKPIVRFKRRLKKKFPAKTPLEETEVELISRLETRFIGKVSFPHYPSTKVTIKLFASSLRDF